jgi:hypothetical protein
MGNETNDAAGLPSDGERVLPCVGDGAAEVSGEVTEAAPEPTKYCAYCKTHKPLADFWKAVKGRLKLAGYCKPCCKSYKSKRYASVQSIWERNKRIHLKAEFLAAYGNVCECCGEGEPDFLTIDHKNNDGEAHRKRLAPNRKRGGSTDEMMRILRKEGWPDYVRILCFNCNFGRRARPGGECPHKRNVRAVIRTLRTV